jgi:hypothetical protein
MAAREEHGRQSFVVVELEGVEEEAAGAGVLSDLALVSVLLAAAGSLPPVEAGELDPDLL